MSVRPFNDIFCDGSRLDLIVKFLTVDALINRIAFFNIVMLPRVARVARVALVNRLAWDLGNLLSLDRRCNTVALSVDSNETQRVMVAGLSRAEQILELC